MYRNRKYNKNAKAKVNEEKKRALNPIDENASIKIPRMDIASGTNAKSKDDGNLEEMLSSEENIPASQEPTQRYLSQRSNFVSTLCRTQSRSMTQRLPTTYFELVLMKAGVQLDEGENFVLSCDHVAFVSKFRELFIKSQNYPDNVEAFKTGLREALNAKSKFTQKLLSGCTISIPGEDSVYQSQDSMIVNFLIIEFLREHVLEVLLDKIEHAANEITPPLLNDNIPLLPLMLSQLRYVSLTHGDLIYQRIKHIFENCSDAAKWDIIASAECILDSSKHDQFAQLLLDNMPNSSELFKANTVQTLTNLCLSARMQCKLRNKILAFIKENKCPNRTLPFLIKFLLKILNEDNDETVRDLIPALREILIWRTTSPTTSAAIADEKQTQLELFHYIEQGLTRSKRFYDLWQKSIQTMSAAEFRSLDFVILLLLIRIKEDRAFYLENLLRRRIKLEHINVDILNDSKLKYSGVLEQHTNTLMHILHDFLREKHKAITDFARASYGILFEIGDAIQKNILKKLLELTCDKSANCMTNLALVLLKDLQRKYTKEVQNWGMLLMPLLDRLSEMSLSQTRLVMDLLCSIAYPAPTLTECPVLQDQIDMLVKKQMINRTSFVKKQGIIGSVQLIDSIARIEETIIETEDFNTTFSTVSDLPDGRGKIAAQYIVRVHSSTMHCPESLALFYDELASVCDASPEEQTNAALLDKPFVIWLCELMTYYFQNSFVAEHAPETTFGIELSYQKCINTIEDTNTEETELPSIAINIAELVLKPATDASSSILVLAPLFNLVRVLHLHRYECSLELINALLGCAIILPTFFDEPEAVFYDFDIDLRMKILDIYFHTANWIRETVSSFTTQREDMIRCKVLIRLAELIQIEERIRKLLLKTPADYAPPLCQFICPASANSGQATTSKTTSGRGRPPSNTTTHKANKSSNRRDANETDALSETNAHNSTIAIGKTTKTAVNKHDFDNLYGHKEIYRQMDSNIMLILHEKLFVNYPLPVEETGKRIGLLEYRFVLTDLVSKLESITGQQKFSSELSLQYIAKPLYFMCDLSKFLNAISSNMDVLASTIHAKLENVKHAYGNTDLFIDGFSLLKVNFGLSLRLLAAYFSWAEFVDVDTKAAKLLKESYLALFEPAKAKEQNAKPSNQIAEILFSKYLQHEPHIVDLKTAVYLYQLLLTLRKLSSSSGSQDAENSKKQAHDIRIFCKKMLLRKWYNYDGSVEKGATCNMYLDELVKGFLKNSDFRRQREILRIVLDETKSLGGKDSALKSFPNIKKGNFPLLFRGLCEVLITSLSDVISSHDAATNDQLDVWEKSCDLLNMLLEIVQALDVPRNFQLYLKHAHLYLKLVLQHGLQIYEQFLRKNPERVSDLLKNLQVTTRFLHNLCCHSKALKNTAIVSQIPFLRETVETLVFRVKAVLAANKCASAFWMGNLKNKDLHGDEIMTQSGSLRGDAPDSEEEIPDDDVSVDETVLGRDESASTDNNENEQQRRSNRSKSSSRSKCF